MRPSIENEFYITYGYVLTIYYNFGIIDNQSVRLNLSGDKINLII